MYWICMHLLGLAIRMLMCIWGMAALWQRGVAQERQQRVDTHPCVSRSAL